MEFDKSWKALFQPGISNEYFTLNNPKPMDVNAKEYSAVNAWWLAELCRLIYKQESDEIGRKATASGRNDFLKNVNLTERKFFNKKGIQAAIFEEVNGKFAVLVFRGTDELKDWAINMNVPLKKIGRGAKVHGGFKRALYQIWKEILLELEQLRSPVYYTGHSLGGALATIAAFKRPPHQLYTFGAPRVGNQAFLDNFGSIKFYRVVNHMDIVPAMPPRIQYRQHGECRYITQNGDLVLQEPRVQGVTMRELYKIIKELMQNIDFSGDIPEILSDHSPVNYVAHLERQLK